MLRVIGRFRGELKGRGMICSWGESARSVRSRYKNKKVSKEAIELASAIEQVLCPLRFLPEGSGLHGFVLLLFAAMSIVLFAQISRPL